jgi:hypothetical protein
MLSRSKKPTSSEYFEQPGVPEFFAADLEKIERIGPCARLTFTSPKSDEGRVLREAVLHLVVPTDRLIDFVRLLTAGPTDLEVVDRSEMLN